MQLSRNLRILLIGANLWYFGEGMMGPLFAIYAEKVGGDILDITWAWATFLIMTGVMYIIVGKTMSKKNNKARVMVMGYAFNAVFTFAYLFVSTPWQLLIVQAGLGVAEALGTPTWDALFAQNANQDDTFSWGLAGGQAQIVTGIAVIAGGLIVHFLSFNILFITMGSMQVIATVIQARILKQK